MRKLILINQTTGYLFADIANTLSEKNDVTLICSSGRNSGEIIISDKVKLERVVKYDKSSTFKRLITWVVSSIQIWWKVFFFHRKGELLIVSNPPFANLLATCLPNKHSHLVYDIYPDVLVFGGVLAKNSLVTKCWSWLNKRVYQQAQHVYTISSGMADCLSQYVDRNKIEIINCWSDSTCLKKINRSENLFIKRYNLEEKFVVLYSGNIGNTHRMEVLIDVAKHLKEETEIKFIIAGEGGKKKLIAEKIKDDKIENVLLLPYQPLDMLSHSLSSADIGVVTLDVSASKLSVPSKTFNLMKVGAAIMVLGSKDSEIGRMLESYEMGECFDPDDIEGIADFIMNMKNDTNKLNKFKCNSEKAVEYFSVKNAKLFMPE